MEPVWWRIEAHYDWVMHTLRGHKTRGYWQCWSLWVGHLGCLTCEECPDTSIEDGKHVGLVIWMSNSNAMLWIGQRLCGLLGHQLFQFSKVSGGHYSEDQIYCYRCMADSTIRKVWLEDEGQGTDPSAAPTPGAGTDQVH